MNDIINCLDFYSTSPYNNSQREFLGLRALSLSIS